MGSFFRVIFLIYIILGSKVVLGQYSDLKIGESTTLSSQVLKEDRLINIYLPEGYEASGEKEYPVIYILDGGMQEDFIHIVGLARFNSQAWIGRLPEAIVVGIENVNRRRDFTFAVDNIDFIEKEGFKKEYFPEYGGSERYIDFIRKELQPFVKRKYRVNSNSTVIGESLAGLLATQILLKSPELFTNYIIISPSLWWGEQSLLKAADKLMKERLQAEVNVYLGVPNKDEDLKMYNESKELFEEIQKNKKVHIVFDYLEDETHATVLHQAVYNAFKVLFKKGVPK